MHANAKVALLLLGLLVGGVAGHLTRPTPVEIVRTGEPPNDDGGSMPPVPVPPTPIALPDRSGGLMAHESGRILIFAACGGVMGLLAGFAVGRS